MEIKKKNNIPAVKICGITDPYEAEQCVKLGADAIGLVFYKKSPRYVSKESAAKICEKLPVGVITTGVFVNENYDFIMERVNKCSLKAVQLHGNESPDLVKKLAGTGLIVIKALFAGKKPYMHDALLYKDVSAFVVEYGKGVLPGGNAETWDWEMAKEITADQTLLLAGGLDPDNVEKAIRSANPDAVDVSSGVEIYPGKKDLAKVKAFINNAHAWHKKR
ncbi:MAG: phosphoribosylanthranilate isomerase [Thermodesulfobacteriota bacterium]|nr:phosphoribosylanthranilate isomerase [Thermodesulfobacteriota bacterium]